MEISEIMDEFNSLKAMYENDFVVEPNHRSCSIVLHSPDDRKTAINLHIKLPLNYPHGFLCIEINAPQMNAVEKAELLKIAKNACRENLGQPMLYACIDALQTKLNSRNVAAESADSESSFDECEYDFEYSSPNNIPGFVSGAPITDRKSTFQAHVAHPVVDASQVPILLKSLKSSAKIEKAKRNIYAYRIATNGASGGKFSEDWFDDGETKAGGRLLRLLTTMNVENALVVVTRWHGGVRLGADRFKHINNAAQILLEQQGVGGKSSDESPCVAGKNKVGDAKK